MPNVHCYFDMCIHKNSFFSAGNRVALTVIQAPPPCGDSEHRAESVSPSTTLRMASSKQQQQRSPSPGSVLLTSATSATIEGRRVTAPQPPHVSLQVTASTMNARYLMLLLNWFDGGFRLAMLPRRGARRLRWQGYCHSASLGFLQAWQRLCIRDTNLALRTPLFLLIPSFLPCRRRRNHDNCHVLLGFWKCRND